MMKRFTILFVLTLFLISAANAAEKLTGTGNLKFGWKFDRCVEAVGDVPKKRTVEEGLEKKFSYAPARWGRIEWDSSVLNFYKDKLYQIGFYKKTAKSDMTPFEQAKVILSAAYGKAVALKTKDCYMWRSPNGNIAILQYAAEEEAGKITGYATYLYLIDNKQVEKKAKAVEKEMQDIINGN